MQKFNYVAGKYASGRYRLSSLKSYENCEEEIYPMNESLYQMDLNCLIESFISDSVKIILNYIFHTRKNILPMKKVKFVCIDFKIC